MTISRISLTTCDVFQRICKVGKDVGATAISILALEEESIIPSIRPTCLAIDFRFFLRTIRESALS